MGGVGWDAVATGFMVSLQPINLIACLGGVFVGTLIGVLPGLGAVTTMSLLLTMTYAMPPTASIIMLAGIYYGAQYGGSTTAILLRIPGEAASVVTVIDGYEMARRGRAGAALGIAAFGSFIAGTLGVAGIMLIGPPLARAALSFGPPEIFALLTLGFTMVTYLSESSKLKAIAMALLGLLLATMGGDPITGVPRFTFGTAALGDGVGLIPLMIGLFGVSEVLMNLRVGLRLELLSAPLKGLLPTKQDWKDAAAPIGRGSVLGFFLGMLPGMGAVVPTLISYAVEKRVSKHPERFGSGAIEGVAAPEAANNAAAAGSMIPLLTLGIAPNVVMAILLGAFLAHGIQPGPLMMRERPEMFWGVIASMYIGNVFLLVLNLPLIGLWVQLLRVPYHALYPVVLLMCMVGVYSESGNVSDIGIMLVFGVAGVVMRRFGYEPTVLVLVFVLGRMAEESLRQSLLMAGTFTIFLTRPIAATFIALTVVVLVLSLLRPWLSARSAVHLSRGG